MRKLGQGYASSVYLAVCKFSKESVIIKVTKKAGLSILNDYQIRREIAIHSRLSHTNLCALHAAFEDNEAYYAVQEHCAGGDLFHKMQQRRTVFTEKECIVKVLLPMLKALYYMHARGVIHRDLKPENILLSARDEIKLGDFGLSIAYLDERPVTRLGTTEYMSPEILLCHTKDQPMDHKQGMEFYGSSVDAWALGVLTYELLVGALPFQGKDRYQISRSIMTDQPKYPTWLSPGAQDFISKALSKLPSMRPSMKDLLRHPWISAYAAMAPAQPPAGSKAPLQTAKSLGAMTMRVERPAASEGGTRAQGEGAPNSEIEPQKPRAAKVGAPSFTAKTMSPSAIQARIRMIAEAKSSAEAPAQGVPATPPTQASAPPASALPDGASTKPDVKSEATSEAKPEDREKNKDKDNKEEVRDRPAARSAQKSDTEGIHTSAQSFSVHALQMNRGLAKEIMAANKNLLENNSPGGGAKAGKVVPLRTSSNAESNADPTKKKTVSFLESPVAKVTAPPDKPSGGRHGAAAATSYVFANHYHASIEFGIDEEQGEGDEEPAAAPPPKANPGHGGAVAVVRSGAVDTRVRAAPGPVQPQQEPQSADDRGKKKGIFKMFGW